MLYLLKQETRDKDAYKVGYAKNLENRFDQYQGHNYNIKLISSREGEIEDELLLHKYLHTFTDLWEFWKSEWYICSPGKEEILLEFNKDWTNIEKSVWENRSNGIFDFYKESNNNLYYKLFSKYNNDSNLELVDIIKDPKLLEKIYQGKLLELNNFFLNNSFFTVRLKYYCEFRTKYPNLSKDILKSVLIPPEYHYYYNQLGPKKIKALNYTKANLEREVKNIFSGDSRKIGIIQRFPVGSKFSLKEIKSTLKLFYDTLGITKVPKAVDILEFLEVKEITPLIDGKRVKGYEILSIK